MCCEEIRLAFNASEKCVQSNTLHAEEDKKKFKIQPKEGTADIFCRIHVDGSLIQDKTRKKCDYWFRQCGKEVSYNYLVEFKGSDIKDGFDQIVDTIAQAKEKGIVLQKKTIHGVIVANKVPLTTPDLQKIKERFTKDHGMSFSVKSMELTLNPE